jgi:outer membrane usher protein FimD/PapC
MLYNTPKTVCSFTCVSWVFRFPGGFGKIIKRISVSVSIEKKSESARQRSYSLSLQEQWMNRSISVSVSIEKKSESARQRSYSLSLSLFFMWAQLGSNQRPPDYESGAANHLSYGPCAKNRTAILLFFDENSNRD